MMGTLVVICYKQLFFLSLFLIIMTCVKMLNDSDKGNAFTRMSEM